MPFFNTLPESADNWATINYSPSSPTRGQINKNDNDGITTKERLSSRIYRNRIIHSRPRISLGDFFLEKGNRITISLSECEFIMKLSS